MAVTLIQTVEVGSGGSAGFDFQNIPQNGTSLILICHLRSTNDAGAVQNYLGFNGTGQTEYVHMQATGNGKTDTIGSGSQAEITYMPGTQISANNFAAFQIVVPAYAGSKAKGVSIASGFSNSVGTDAWGGYANVSYESTSAITSIQLEPISGNYAQHSIASLYAVIP